MMLRNQKGGAAIDFTLFLVLVIIAGLILFGAYVAVRANIWFTEDGVFYELRDKNLGVSDVIKVERHVFDKSVITVREYGSPRRYCLDTNLLLMYNLEPCKK